MKFESSLILALQFTFKLPMLYYRLAERKVRLKADFMCGGTIGILPSEKNYNNKQ